MAREVSAGRIPARGQIRIALACVELTSESVAPSRFEEMFPTRSSVILHHATTTSLRLDFISVVNKAGFACHSRCHAFSVIIPDYQYTSHQAMVACLSPLTRLTEISLEFETDSPFPFLMKLTSDCDDTFCPSRSHLF